MAAATSSSSSPSECKTLCVLALHGSGGTADSFTKTVEQWSDVLQSDFNVALDITAVPAPVPKEGGFAWWSMPPGVRSFDAWEYGRFDESKQLVLEALSMQQFDLIVGHSQGAILTTALLALGLIPHHPTRGYILNGVAWPAPYTKELDQLRLSNSNPRVLLVVGDRDAMNPPFQAKRVEDALSKAGFDASSVYHPGGHSVPIENDDTLQSILKWILAE